MKNSNCSPDAAEEAYCDTGINLPFDANAPFDTNGRIRSRKNRLDKLKGKLKELGETYNLSKIFWFIKGFIDNDVDIMYPNGEGGLLILDKHVPLLIISDSHGLRRKLLDFLFEKKYIGEKTDFQLLAEGAIQVVMLGDALHTENKALWTNCLIDEYMKQYVNHGFYGEMPNIEREMADSLGLVAMVMCMLRHFPNFHYLKGNHDNLRNTTEDGNLKVVKYLGHQDHGEGAILRAGVESWLIRRRLRQVGIRSWETFLDEYDKLHDRLAHNNYSPDEYFKIYGLWMEDFEYLKAHPGWICYNAFFAGYSNWENRLPIMAVYEGELLRVVMSHAPPGEAVIDDVQTIRSRSDKIVFNFTWPNGVNERSGLYVSRIFEVVFKDNAYRDNVSNDNGPVAGGFFGRFSDKLPDKLYVAGHINTGDGVLVVDEKRLVMIHKPGVLVVLLIYPDQRLFSVDLISS
ncbi:MAG: hypothetical protein HQK89_03570 [Nitrospirae bacterium]|nr:hypothetical protein [Nitrospirota bacterium]